jgi:hypothetical protein
VMTALSTTTEDEVIVLSDAQGLHAIPVHRSRGDRRPPSRDAVTTG